MGVRYLNRFIQKHCVNSISRVHLRDFTGKRVAVDASIYLYRYSGEGALLENVYLMASVFRHYNIHAVFVFDGPPPPQKTELIEKRRKKKEEAKREYDRLEKLLKEHPSQSSSSSSSSSSSTPEVSIDEIHETMRELKKQFVRLRDCDISTVKELLVSFGFATIDAEGEADVLCANLSIKRRVDACLSDDMDMFVYGCPVVLRSLSLLNHTVVSYNTQDIMKTLKISQQEFKMMCVICGTDYSTTASVTSTSTSTPEFVYKELMKYKQLTVKEKEKCHNSGGGFYDWYSDYHVKGAVSAITYLTEEGMFDTRPTGSGPGTGPGPYKQLVVLNRENIHKKRIVEIMTKEDFIFVDSSPSDENIITSLSTGQTTLSPSLVYNDIIYERGGGCGTGSGSGSASEAGIIAKEVYDIDDDVSSFQELQDARIKSKTIPIKKRKQAGSESI
jgi:5'-3' exonuclease